MSYLTAFFEFFRFIQRYRDRQEARFAREANEREAERQHQREMLNIIFSKMVEQQSTQSNALIAIAEAQAKQAGVMQSWFDGFKIQDPSPARPQVAITDDARAEMLQHLAELGLSDIDPESLPPEFSLAFHLQQAERESEG